MKEVAKAKSAAKEGGGGGNAGKSLHRGWTTPEQLAWLEYLVPVYLTAKVAGSRKLSDFWKGAYEEWFIRWPVQLPVPPESEGGGNLTIDTAKDDSVLDGNKLRIRQWYNNHTRNLTSSEGRTTRKILKFDKKKAKKLSLTQAYSHLYTQTKLKPLILQKWADHVAAHPEDQVGNRVPLRWRNQFVSELYEEESDDVKGKVEKYRDEAGDEEELKTDSNEAGIDEAERNRRAKAFGFQKGQDCLPLTMTRVLETIEAETGLVGTILLGGPEPRCNGEIVCMSFHSGHTAVGNNFSQANLTFTENIERPFVHYLHRVFSEEIRKSWALPGAASASEIEVDDNTADDVQQAIEKAIAKRQQVQNGSTKDAGIAAAVVTSNDSVKPSKKDHVNATIPSGAEPTVIVNDASFVELSALDKALWPDWIQAAVHYFETVSESPQWAKLLLRWITFEKVLLYAGTGRLDMKGRPNEVGVWLKNGRKYSSSMLPEIVSTQNYAGSWWAWWTQLQPEWRREDQSDSLSREIPLTHTDLMIWNGLCVGGPNGIFTVVMALAWWIKTLDGETSIDVKLANALDDIHWVMDSMVKHQDVSSKGKSKSPDVLESSSLGKRHHESDGASDDKKRPKKRNTPKKK